MSGIINKAVQIGSLGLVKDVTGVEGAGEAAREAAGLQSSAAGAGIDEQRRQFDITTGQLTAAEQANREALQSGQQQQQGALDPFAQAGVGALQQQQALLGLGTQEQQQAAFASFNESPGQQFLRSRGQKALLRNASAIGGIGGGNVRSALVEQGTGFAQQDFANQFSRLQQLSGQGLSAAQGIGAGALGTAQGIGSGAMNTAARQGQFGSQTAGNISNLLGQQSQARASGILGEQQVKSQFNQQLLQAGGAALGAFSDKRLKSNIKKVGEFKGVNWYTWDWNELANKIGLSGKSSGVIANEIEIIKPDLVTRNENGYLMVNYEGLGV